MRAETGPLIHQTPPRTRQPEPPSSRPARRVGKAERNDRLFAVPRRSHSEQAIRDVRDLSKPIQQELEKFFIATDELEDKKLEIIGWKGPKIAMKAIKDSAKSFSKDGE